MNDLSGSEHVVIEPRGRFERSKTEEREEFVEPANHLFLWAVLQNRQELAEIFWRAGTDQLGAALTANCLLKSLSKQARRAEETDLAQELLTNSTRFGQLAVSVLGECYSMDKTTAHRLLVRELPSWGSTTLLALADSAHHMDFLGHCACQTKLNKVWRGKMKLQTPAWKIILALLNPFALSLIRFSRKTPKSITDEPRTSQKISPQQFRDALDGNRKKKSGEPEHWFSKSVKSHQSVSLHPPLVSGGKKFYRVSLFDRHSKDNIGLVSAAYFYHGAPVTKFMYNVISYLVLLFLFSYVVLTDLRPVDQPNSPSYLERCLWFWVLTLALEELRQMMSQTHAHKFRQSVVTWFDSTWNKLDFTMYVMFSACFVLRHLLLGHTFFYVRVAYCVTVLMFYLRVAHMFYVHKQIGPKIVMIRKMLKDLSFFLFILMVSVLSFGVPIHALLYPNEEPSLGLLLRVIYLPYWQIYGEIFLDNVEGNLEEGSCYTNMTTHLLHPHLPRCPEKTMSVAPLLTAVYMLVTNVLLLNLLIAMFSYTFEQVQEKTEMVWRFYRYQIISEYVERPPFPAPFIVIMHVYRAARWLWGKYRRTNDHTKTSLKKRRDPIENQHLTAFEKQAVENYLLHCHDGCTDDNTSKSSTVIAAQKLEKVIEHLEEIKELHEEQRVTSQDGGGSLAREDGQLDQIVGMLRTLQRKPGKP